MSDQQPHRHHRDAGRRKPENLYRHGNEPDPRFSLANERTALAWMRTALALVAAGIAITSISSLGVVPRWTALIGAASCLGGALLAWRAVAGWERVERALRLKKPLPSPRALAMLAGGVIVLAAVMVLISLAELLRR